MMDIPDIFCVIIPTYNNAGSILGVIRDVEKYCRSIIVVCDGATDGTSDLLEGLGKEIMLISYPENRGKGHALALGFRKAAEEGFRYAVTMDSDGQHFPGDLPLFADAAAMHPDSIIVGSRSFNVSNMPSGNTFANKFSNFWFTVQTGLKIPDTQTGFRLYPLSRIAGMHLFTSRYETELEVLVRSAWKGTDIVSVPVRVYYPEKGKRVSFFRPGRDFIRISFLNAFFCFAAIFYGYPSKLFRMANRNSAAR